MQALISFVQKIGRFLLLGSIAMTAQAQTPGPKIGLVLSGGGAKGLGHIGILKAIDSANLRIQYISGTSMGSIIGAMYAAGLSADEIEKTARGINWDQLLTNQSLLRSYIMEEKSEYNRYAIELPISHGKIKLASGLLEAEELWLKLTEIFYPTFGIQHFRDLPIPFACVATDLSTGQDLVLDSGNLVTAIRSSMAIPGVFTAVKRDGRTLVDGGVVRNLPASVARKMGAEWIIGSDVGSPLKSGDSLNSPIEVMLQVAFFPDAANKPEEDKLCNLLIHQDLDEWGSAGFDSSPEIIQAGIEKGRALYPVFKRMADSLARIYGPPPPKPQALKGGPVVVDEIIIHGLRLTDAEFFRKLIGIRSGDTVSEELMSRKIRNAFGTRYYNKILYRYEPAPAGKTKLIFDVTENPLTTAKVGLHYNRATGISAIVNLTTRNWLFPKSRDLVSVNLGENFKVRAEHMQLIGPGAGHFTWFVDAYYESQELNQYQSLEKTGLYGQRYQQIGSRVQISRKRNRSYGLGGRYEWIEYRPQIQGKNMINGSNRNAYLYVYGEHNTLNKAILPDHGIKLSYELGAVTGQQASGTISLANGTQTGIDQLGLDFSPHQKLIAQLEAYKTDRKKNTFIHLAQLGVLFNNEQVLFHDFWVGGLNKVIRNQAFLAGLEEASLVSPSFASYAFCWRRKWTANLYSTLRADLMAYDFLLTKNTGATPKWLVGHAATVGYNSPIGPLEFSVMYAYEKKQVLTYINLGLPF